MNNAVSPEKILLAVRPVDREVVSKVLGDEFNLLLCYTLEEAIQGLDDSVALIVCGVRFDQGAMYELLSAARSNPNTSYVPYFLIVGEDVKYSPAIMEGIRKAALVRGVTGFIELAKRNSELGREEAYKQIRERIRNLLDAFPHRGNMGGMSRSSGESRNTIR